MIRAQFTALDGGKSHRALVLSLLHTARKAIAAGSAVELQIMCFAFTDPLIGADLEGFVRDCPSALVRILSDWSQGAPGKGSEVRRLAALDLPNLFVKYKIDRPYRRDPASGRLVWCHSASLGMFHHKSLLLVADGRPAVLQLGSYNWSARGLNSYENSLLIGHAPETTPLLAAFQDEFQALWADQRMTATPSRAVALFAQFAQNPQADIAATLTGLIGGDGPPPAPNLPAVDIGAQGCVAAFASRAPCATQPRRGHAAQNHRRRLDLLRPNGMRRPAPLTLNTLALEAIRSARPGSRILCAAFALSRSVPECDALIAAAQRGCDVRVVLDCAQSAKAAASLRAAAAQGIRLDVRMSKRAMHQKYIAFPDDAMVITGTANFTSEATRLHCEHRLLLRDQPDIAARFAQDFQTIWGRCAACAPVAP